MRITTALSSSRAWSALLVLGMAVGAACAANGGGEDYGSPGTAGAGASSATGGGPATDGAAGGAEDGSTEAATGGAGGLSGTGGSGGDEDGGVITDGAVGGNGQCPQPVAPQAGPPAATDVLLGGAPGDAATKFSGGADPSRAPTLLYPPDGTMMPPNISTIDVQFLPGAQNDLFEISFLSNEVNHRIYAPCTAVGSGCSVRLDKNLFGFICKQAAGKAPLTIQVRGVNAADPQAYGESVTRTLSVGEDGMLGGIYYWDAAGRVVRYDFGHPTAQGEPYYTQLNGGAMCVGCHSLSSRGYVMAVGLNIPAPSTLRVIDVATKAQRFQLNGFEGSNFQAFSPDETELITSNGANMILRDAFQGFAKAPNPLVAKGTMPDFKPDNTAIVFARPSGFAMASPGIDKGSLFLLHRNGASWGPEQLLVWASGSENNYYPAFSPDGNWVLYNHSASENSYLAPDSTIRAVSSAGGTVVALDQANMSNQVGNSWPKWAPFRQCYRGKHLMWFTFSSARDYGVRIINSDKPVDPDAGDKRKWQVWMAAFDPEKAGMGQDASYPAFWLPFQDEGTGNHIAQWVEKVVRNPCTIDQECAPGTVCEFGECVPAQ